MTQTVTETGEHDEVELVVVELEGVEELVVEELDEVEVEDDFDLVWLVLDLVWLVLDEVDEL